MEKNNIADLSNAEFTSFLFLERNRENSLSDYHGWNNWALGGAIVSVILAGYTLLKNNPSLAALNVLYYVDCLSALFLAYHSWARLFTRVRGVDFSKVRMLKEVFPIVNVVFIFLFAIASTILIPITDGFNSVFWLWLIIVLVYISVTIIAISLKEKVVPSYFKEMVLPWIWINVGFDTFTGGLWGLIVIKSFKLAGGCIFTPEFEFAACISAIYVLLFILFKLNFSNRVVRRFDEIIDMYLYAGNSKEESFHELLKNRMGYGVLDVCYKELRGVEKKTEMCLAEEKELDDIKDRAIAGEYTINQFEEEQVRVDKVIKGIYDTLGLSKSLINRMDEILKVSPYFRNNSEINYVLDISCQCINKVEIVFEKAKVVSRLLYDLEAQSLRKEKKLLESIHGFLLERRDTMAGDNS